MWNSKNRAHAIHRNSFRQHVARSRSSIGKGEEITNDVDVRQIRGSVDYVAREDAIALVSFLTLLAETKEREEGEERLVKLEQ